MVVIQWEESRIWDKSSVYQIIGEEKGMKDKW